MKYYLSIVLMLLFYKPAFSQITNESELSLLKTGGNSEAQTTNAKTSNQYSWSKDLIKFGGHYTYGEAQKNVSVRNWDINSKYEKELNHKVSLVSGEIIEGNRFTGIKARYNSDLGVKYSYLKSDSKNLFSELSYRYSIEDRFQPLPNAYDHKARFYNELNHKYSETVQYKFWLEYVPNFTETDDYLINGEASLISIINSRFSLKVAYMGMYDNKPAQSGFKNYDYITTTALVAKF